MALLAFCRLQPLWPASRVHRSPSPGHGVFKFPWPAESCQAVGNKRVNTLHE